MRNPVSYSLKFNSVKTHTVYLFQRVISLCTPAFIKIKAQLMQIKSYMSSLVLVHIVMGNPTLTSIKPKLINVGVPPHD